VKYVVDTTSATGRDKAASDLTESEAGAPGNDDGNVDQLIYCAAHICPSFFGRSEMPESIAGVVFIDRCMSLDELRETCMALSASLGGADTEQPPSR
jgi:hypothetical protein